MRRKRIESVTRTLALAAAFVCAFCCAAFADAAEPVVPEDHGIPVVYVNVDESGEYTIEDMHASPDHSVKCKGSVDITIPDNYTGGWGQTPYTDLTDLKLKYIRGRGNSTWEQEKKPYKIKFKTEQDLFGMGADTEWALMANYGDRTLVKNLITGWLGEQMELAFCPRGIPVDLVLSGDSDKYGSKYLGSYVLSELVNIGPGRVAIDQLDPEVKESEEEAADGEPNTSGGHLLAAYSAFQDADEPESNYFETANGTAWIHKDPEFTDAELTEGQQNQQTYIRNYVQKLEDLIMAGPIDHQAVAELMDMQSAADYWLIQEFCMNGDAYGTHSTYMYKPRGDKLYWGPLWDFDLGWGPPEEPDNYFRFNYTEMLWLDRLCAYDPDFRTLIQKRWPVLKSALEKLVEKDGILDQYEKELDPSWVADYALWPVEYDDPGVTYANKLDELRSFIAYRIRNFDDNLANDLGTVYITAHFCYGDQEIATYDNVRIGDQISDLPKEPTRKGYVFKGWYEKDTGKELYEVETDHEITFIPKYVSASKAVAPKALYLRNYEDWAPLQDKTFVIPSMDVYPENATDSRVTLTSSDTSVATVKSSNILRLHSTGDVVIKAKTYNGISASLLLHVYDSETTEKQDPVSMKAKASSFTLSKGQQRQILFELQPAGVPLNYMGFDFRSSNESIAEVDYLGIVIAKKAGTVTIKYSVFDYDEKTICGGSCKVTVRKSANPLSVTGKTVKLKAKKLKKKARTIKRSKALTIRKHEGKLSYKLVKVTKKKYKKYFKVNASTGKIKVKKKLRKGTYTLKIQVKAAGNSQYKAAARIATVKIRVR